MWDYLKSRHMRRLERKVDQIMADIKDLKPILDGIKDDVGVVQTGIGSLQTKLQTVSDALAAAQAAGAVIPADVQTGIDAAVSEAGDIKTSLDGIAAALAPPAAPAAPAT